MSDAFSELAVQSEDQLNVMCVKRGFQVNFSFAEHCGEIPTRDIVLNDETYQLKKAYTCCSSDHFLTSILSRNNLILVESKKNIPKFYSQFLIRKYTDLNLKLVFGNLGTHKKCALCKPAVLKLFGSAILCIDVCRVMAPTCVD